MRMLATRSLGALPRRPLRASVFVLAALWVAAGDVDSLSLESAPGPCVESGSRCALGDGPVGVCERSPCGAGAEPPCFRCVPQH